MRVEIDKVRTGSRRRDRIGDIDAWEGGRLAITAEVKQRELTEEHVSELAKFAGDVAIRGAIGMVVALSFTPGAKEGIEAMGLIAIDIDDLLRIVSLWDPMKQRTAVASFEYYAHHVERNSSLSNRLRAFVKDRSECPKG